MIAPAGAMGVPYDPIIVTGGRPSVTDQNDSVIITPWITVREPVHNYGSLVVHELLKASVDGYPSLKNNQKFLQIYLKKLNNYPIGP